MNRSIMDKGVIRNLELKKSHFIVTWKLLYPDRDGYYMLTIKIVMLSVIPSSFRPSVVALAIAISFSSSLA